MERGIARSERKVREEIGRESFGEFCESGVLSVMFKLIPQLSHFATLELEVGQDLRTVLLVVMVVVRRGQISADSSTVP